MSTEEPDLRVETHGIDPQGRPYTLIGHLSSADFPALAPPTPDYSEKITKVRLAAEAKSVRLVEVDELAELRAHIAGMPPMSPVGWWWRHIVSDDHGVWGWSVWTLALNYSEIPTDQSGIQIQTLYATDLPT